MAITISRNKPTAPVQYENIARDFRLKEVNTAEARREARRADDDDSSIRWGGASSFDTSQAGGGGVTIIKRPPPDEPPGERPVKVYNEVQREVSKVKVYNPDDQEQWIEVERINRIRFQGPEEWDVEFVLDHDAEPIGAV